MRALKQGRVALAFVCIVLGIMLAVQFRTTQDIRSTIPFQRAEDLSQRLKLAEKERDSALRQLQEFENSTRAESVVREVDMFRMAAGYVAVEGPGLVVTIDDSKRAIKPGENPNLYLIHDDDMLKVINELWAAGAEALSINEQRLVVGSEIRCVGPTIMVNDTRYSPPYEIRAIGDPKTLEASLKMRGGVIETLQFWGIQATVKTQQNVKVAAYKGTHKFQFAKPIQEDTPK
ncbi:MAG: hypothetical protein H6Q76_494 [Firmicutes bacterium]|nr:hypothetical protein [Bacillota bacterium]